MKFIITWGCAPQAKNFSPFLLQFCIFESIGEKIWILFTNRGKNMHFPPLFIPFNHFFFPQLVVWLYFCPPPPGGGQTEKYTPLSLCWWYVLFYIFCCNKEGIYDIIWLFVKIPWYIIEKGSDKLRVWAIPEGSFFIIFDEFWE